MGPDDHPIHLLDSSPGYDQATVKIFFLQKLYGAVFQRTVHGFGRISESVGSGTRALGAVTHGLNGTLTASSVHTKFSFKILSSAREKLQPLVSKTEKTPTAIKGEVELQIIEGEVKPQHVRIGKGGGRNFVVEREIKL